MQRPEFQDQNPIAYGDLSNLIWESFRGQRSGAWPGRPQERPIHF